MYYVGQNPLLQSSNEISPNLFISGVVTSLSNQIYALELAAFFELKKKATKSTYREEGGTAKRRP